MNWVLSGSYLINILGFINCNSMFLFWIMLELNLLLFVLILTCAENEGLDKFKMESLNYFIIQSFGSILFLVSFSMGDSILFSINEGILVTSLLIKLALYPTSFWVYLMSNKLNYFCFWLLLSIQKLPLMIYLFSLDSNMVLFVLSLNVVMGCAYLIVSLDFRQVLISSSIYFTFWFFLSYGVSFSFYLLFYFIYTIMFSLFLFSYKDPNRILNISSDSIMVFLFILFLLGLPPMPLFFMKLWSCDLFLLAWGVPFFLFIFFFTFLSLIGYFKFFFWAFLKFKDLNSESLEKKKISFILTVMSFLFLASFL
uniref:NADH-ubiquinone oxidoreductase chain 2 n=1 Tax=Epitrimerus sabinae TaxID=1452570 RepID=A0A0U2PTQ0_9ACAR|nr:NADH dehydrogenase subunit 2 [Epitrimerus sabinae]ALK03795.1 NADH dehydrogenase subunit 2 [Epitrimerus sabinae]